MGTTAWRAIGLALVCTVGGCGEPTAPVGAHREWVVVGGAFHADVQLTDTALDPQQRADSIASWAKDGVTINPLTFAQGEASVSDVGVGWAGSCTSMIYEWHRGSDPTATGYLMECRVADRFFRLSGALASATAIPDSLTMILVRDKFPATDATVTRR
jgi:hypothetical protein